MPGWSSVPYIQHSAELTDQAAVSAGPSGVGRVRATASIRATGVAVVNVPTRFYLPSSGTPVVSPTISAEWEHSSGIRRPMSTVKGSSTLTTTAYTPDGSDHVVDQDALHVQFVSEPLSAQTIPVQSFTVTAQASEAHANNELLGTFKVFVWTAAGGVGSTLVPITRGTLELTTTLQNRSGTVVTSEVTVGDGDRLVFELGLGGLPVAAGGVQGHNGSIRFGESGLTDAPVNDTSTSTTENPWIEFGQTITLAPPPATSAVALLAQRAALATTAEKASTVTVPSVRGLVHATTTAVAFVPEIKRRARVLWAQFVVPEAGAVPLTVTLRGTGRISTTVAGRAATTLAAIAGSGQLAVSAAKASSTTVVFRGTTAVSAAATKGGVVAPILRAGGRSTAAGIHAATTTTSLRSPGRAVSTAIAYFPEIQLGFGTAVARGRARLQTTAVAGRTTTVRRTGFSRSLVVASAGRTAVARLNSRPSVFTTVFSKHRYSTVGATGSIVLSGQGVSAALTVFETAPTVGQIVLTGQGISFEINPSNEAEYRWLLNPTQTAVYRVAVPTNGSRQYKTGGNPTQTPVYREPLVEDESPRYTVGGTATQTRTYRHTRTGADRDEQHRR